jgi:hypothetical protein
MSMFFLCIAKFQQKINLQKFILAHEKCKKNLSSEFFFQNGCLRQFLIFQLPYFYSLWVNHSYPLFYILWGIQLQFWYTGKNTVHKITINFENLMMWWNITMCSWPMVHIAVCTCVCYWHVIFLIITLSVRDCHFYKGPRQHVHSITKDTYYMYIQIIMITSTDDQLMLGNTKWQNIK